jgi:hypothetical protein
MVLSGQSHLVCGRGGSGGVTQSPHCPCKCARTIIEPQIESLFKASKCRPIGLQMENLLLLALPYFDKIQTLFFTLQPSEILLCLYNTGV